MAFIVSAGLMITKFLSETNKHDSVMPVLSFILCSRNDQYMGNSLWRLQTSLNYLAQNVQALGLEDQVEVVVSDWGSETPLREVLQLSSLAARLTRFIQIPKPLADELQRDSPFAEVFALNAAAGRARGKYIGRIDQDTLVGKRFLQAIVDRTKQEPPLSMGFANLKMINYRFAVQCPSLSNVSRFIDLFGGRLRTENSRSTSPYYFAGVGIWLLHRDVWFESGGYDERMIYMNAMETNMIMRLLKKYEMVDLGKLSDYDFYHLEHYHPWTVRKSSAHRKVNPHLPFSQPDQMNPNGDTWGMKDYSLEILPGKNLDIEDQDRSFLLLMLSVGPVIAVDWIGLWAKRLIQKWIRKSPRSRLRRIMRGSFYQLPSRLQYHIGAAKRTLLQQFDWAPQVRRLRRAEDDYINETAQRSRSLPKRKRIAIYSLQHWSPLEYGLAMALHLRGHDVRGILCDGLLPLCEMNLGPNMRPPCDACIMNLSRYEEAFGLSYERLKDYLTSNDLSAAAKLVADTPDDKLLELTVSDVPVGRFARREIQRYYRGFIFEPQADPAFRKWLTSAVLHTWLSERWLDHGQPDIVGVCSGRTLPTACIFAVARQRGIQVVTWDGVATRPDGFMFARNESATEIPLDAPWSSYRDVPLSPDEVDELRAFMGAWSRSEVTPFPYNTQPLEDEDRIRKQLQLRSGAPLVVAYTNTSWDIAVIDRDVGFDSMFDWLFTVVEAANSHPEIDVVVRAHPAEKKVPAELQSRTPVGAELRKRFALPANLKIIEGDDPISSYTLSSMAQVNMLYASRLGLELALAGLKPWIAGAVTYRNKGFTLDLESKAHMFSLLENVARETLSDHQVTLAERFAYLWFFRYEVRLPLVKVPGNRFSLKSFSELGPGGDETIDAICEAFVSGEPFVSLSRRHETELSTAR
jgi:hypothetical protein